MSLLSCIKKAFASLFSSKKIYVRMQDFLFWLSMPLKKDKIRNLFLEHQEEINKKNKKITETYQENLARQEFYLDHALEQIQKIKTKQKEIVAYLNELGYSVKSYHEDERD